MTNKLTTISSAFRSCRLAELLNSIRQDDRRVFTDWREHISRTIREIVRMKRLRERTRRVCFVR